MMWAGGREGFPQRTWALALRVSGRDGEPCEVHGAGHVHHVAARLPRSGGASSLISVSLTWQVRVPDIFAAPEMVMTRNITDVVASDIVSATSSNNPPTREVLHSLPQPTWPTSLQLDQPWA